MRKSKLLFLLGTALITTSVIFMTACHKDNNSTSPLDSDDNGGYASDNSKMEQNSDDVISIADQAAVTNSGANLRTTSGGIPSVSRYLDTSGTYSGDSVLVINFGTTDYTCIDGKNRRGSIIVYYQGLYKATGSVHTITYSGYYVNDNQLTGIKTVTNEGLNSSGQDYYNVTVNDTLNLGTGNGEIVWMGNRVRTWLTGYGSSTRTDDSYLVSGTTTLTRADGNTFTMVITTPLQIAYGCAWIEAGVLNITGPGGGTRILNYGNGNCDDEAQLTLANGKTYNITL